jgi:serine/threonine protein kinase
MLSKRNTGHNISQDLPPTDPGNSEGNAIHDEALGLSSSHAENSSNTSDTSEAALPPAAQINLEDSTKMGNVIGASTILVNRTASGYSGNYKILELIGKGGTSEVYKAIIESTKSVDLLHPIQRNNQTVACKVLFDQLLDDQQHYKRFHHEATMAERLCHPNIVNVLDAGELGTRPFLVLDYLEGTSLSAAYKKTKCLSIERALPIFLQIADAFGYAHTSGIIHRDLKPSNIMLIKSKTTDDFVKVVDFGIAKIVSETTVGSTKLTKTGEVFGTPIYMSPEQCRGESIDARSDIYSFGILMYEVLTGHPPFEGSDYWSLLYKHNNEIPKSIKDIDPDVRLCQKLESIIFKCLEKLPSARYQKMDEVKHDLAIAITSGSTGSKFMARLNRYSSQIIRNANTSLSKPLKTRIWLVLATLTLIAGIGATTVLRNQSKAEEEVTIKTFLKDMPATQRTINWIEPDPPKYAHDSAQFQELENAFLAEGKLVKALGDTNTEAGFSHKVKFGNFYLREGIYERADNEFTLAEQIGNYLKLADTPDMYKQLANLERNMALCALNKGEFERCIKYASKSKDLCEMHPTKNYNVFASEVIPAWELIGRAALAQHNLKLATKAFTTVYELSTRNDHFKAMPEHNALLFARTGDFFLESDDLTKTEALYNYAILGWRHTGNHLNEGIAINKLGLVAMKSNDWKKALEYFKQAENTIMQVKDASNDLVAKVLLNEADAYQMAHETESASQCVKEAKRLWFAPRH